MGLERFSSSDYGSGCSMDSSTSWGSQELDWQAFQNQLLNAERTRSTRAKAASYSDLVGGRCTIKDVMQEFRMNGSDAPYNPDDDASWRNANAAAAPAYRRQVSWPAAAERARPPRPLSARFPPLATPMPMLSAPLEQPIASTPIPVPNTGRNEGALPPLSPPGAAGGGLTEQQRLVLHSLPDAAVLTLLREMQRRNKLQHQQPEECRFCKNNGERETYYRAHSLKDALGRVACPVLRAFVCRRCGARGDYAHTIKYCPMSTREERIKSAAMMRSMRMASGRRRSLAPPGGDDEHYVVFGEPPAAALRDHQLYAYHSQRAPLDPRWTALEQKLMLS